jgi:glycosyltransferase involved in cell wall biosynthesis
MKVSVLVKTFDHEACIAQTLGSVLSQAAPFDWELVVGEDCSRDGTREVVREVAARLPGRVRPLFRERNLGPVANFIDTLAACRGTYVALLDGDDFWTVPHKLARQAAYLDAHAEAPACTHDALVVDAKGNGDGTRYCSPRLPASLTLERVLKGNPVPACSLMFRREALLPLPPWFPCLPFTDWPLLVLLARRGPVGYDPEPMAAYRVHGGGLWSGMPSVARIRSRLALLERFRAELGPEHDALIRGRMARVALQLALACAESGDRGASRAALRRAFRLAGARFPRLLVRRDFRRLLPRLF